MFLLCKVMQVSRSGYYHWKKRGPSAREKERTQLISQVRAIHQGSKDVKELLGHADVATTMIYPPCAQPARVGRPQPAGQPVEEGSGRGSLRRSFLFPPTPGRLQTGCRRAAPGCQRSTPPLEAAVRAPGEAVAHDMTELVVDRLEFVEIEEEQGLLLAVALRLPPVLAVEGGQKPRVSKTGRAKARSLQLSRRQSATA